MVNLACGTGDPSYAVGSSFANQMLAQVELCTRLGRCPVGVHAPPKHLDEKVARLQLSALSAKLTVLTGEQARYIGIHPAGPSKAGQYRY